jgi:hypothetical protein
MIERIDSTTPIEKIIGYCNASIGDERPGSVNMDPVDWENKPHTFLHCLYKEKRYDLPSGAYFVYIEDNKVVMGEGFSTWNINSSVALFCSRAYTVPEFQSHRSARMRNALTAACGDLAFELGFKSFFITANEYNKRILERVIHLTNPEINRAKKDGLRYRKSEGHYFYWPFTLFQNLVMINQTKQWVLYHAFNEDEKYNEELKQCLTNHAI